MRAEADRRAERDERARHEVERGCGCGYWVAADPELEDIATGAVVKTKAAAYLMHPHPKCSCEPARKLREKGRGA